MSSRGEYEREMVKSNALKQAALAKFESTLESRAPSDDPVVLANGGNTYANLCGPCHRMDGGGLVGPNLTDDFWIHGPGFVDNLKVIWNGVPDKGMLSWKEVLNPDQIYAVASYIHTLRGREVPNPKPPEIQGAAPAQNVYE